MKITYEEFKLDTGKKIMDMRIKRKYTREYLAEAADISSKFLYEIEMGKKGYSAYIMFRLAYALGVNVNNLTGGESFVTGNIITVHLRDKSGEQKQTEQILEIVL